MNRDEHIIECLRIYILTENSMRKNPCGWKSCGPRDTPEWREYKVLREQHDEATAKLWMATDIEYDEDGFREHVWNWRYWKVMARKCCWYQTTHHGTELAAGTMSNLAHAEAQFVEACGLTSIYITACEHIEAKFPNLKP